MNVIQRLVWFPSGEMALREGFVEIDEEERNCCWTMHMSEGATWGAIASYIKQSTLRYKLNGEKAEPNNPIFLKISKTYWAPLKNGLFHHIKSQGIVVWVEVVSPWGVRVPRLMEPPMFKLFFRFNPISMRREYAAVMKVEPPPDFFAEQDLREDAGLGLRGEAIDWKAHVLDIFGWSPTMEWGAQGTAGRARKGHIRSPVMNYMPVVRQREFLLFINNRNFAQTLCPQLFT